MTAAILITIYLFLAVIVVRAFMWCNPPESIWESGVCNSFVARRNIETGEVQRPFKKGDTVVWKSLPFYTWKNFEKLDD